MDIREAVAQLSDLTRAISTAGITAGTYGAWGRQHETDLAQAMDYHREVTMQPIYTLVRPFFHPTLPLIGWNYTPVAHNTLFNISGGWTMPLRLARGIIFDRNGVLVALPFMKFFNYGEHAETRTLPHEPFEATMKHDGHLGEIFRYNGTLLVTSRGDFCSRTSMLAQRMLRVVAKKNRWATQFPDDTTILVEIIHPDTKVHVNYGDDERFMLIGATHLSSLRDEPHTALVTLGNQLGLTVTERWAGSNIQDLVALMRSRDVRNQEGYVVRFASGMRMKLKFDTYIALMVEGKLNLSYLMKRFVAGNLQRMLLTLDEEAYRAALQMLGQIMFAVSVGSTQTAKWRELYQLLPDGSATDYHRAGCREFVRHLFPHLPRA